MIIAGRTQPLSGQSWRQALQTLRDLGFDGAEVCLENPDLAPALLDENVACQAHELLETLGFTEWSVSYHKDLLDDGYYVETVKAIELTPLFGAQVLVIGGPSLRAAWPDVLDRLAARLRDLCAVAADCGVTLAEEAEPGFVIGSTADLLRLFDAVGSDRLAANLDLGHAFLCDPDPLGAIAALGPRIAHVHIENMNRGVHDHQLPWEGDMDLGAYVAALQDVGFRGLAALDLYRHDYVAVAPRAIAHIRNLLREEPR